MKRRDLLLPNNTKKNFFINVLKASFGLFLFGIGSYLTNQAGLGTVPWNTLNMGVSRSLHILYGNASIIVGFMFIIMDIILREPIGIGMILDAVIVGKTVDLFNYLNLVPEQTAIVPGIIIMIIGLAIGGYSQYLYMSAALGCGPRDAFLVGLYKRIPKIPVGVHSIILLSLATFFGWLLGGTVGIGTIMGAVLTGPFMQLSFKIMNTDAGEIKHQSISQSLFLFFHK